MPELNNTANVSVGKGVEGGYMFTAPVGTVLPTDYATPLGEEWTNVGFLTDEGVTRSLDAQSDTYKDLNGDDIYTAISSRTRTLALQFAEVNTRSLAEVYGEQNVIEENDLIKVRHNNAEVPHRSIVLELVMRDGRRWRRVIEDAQVTDWSDETVVSSQLLVMGVTYTINKGNTTQDFIIDYMQPAGGQDTPTPDPDPDPDPDPTPNFNTMTKTELLAWAEEHEIEGLNDSMTNAEIIAAIEEALAG